MRTVLPILITLCAALGAGSAAAASFDEVERSSYGSWSAALYRNTDGGQLFCALESASENPVFRINSYLEDNDTFLEIFDQDWSKRQGAVRFSLVFAGGPDLDGVSMDLPGRSWGDSYTFDILEERDFVAILGGLAGAQQVEVADSNGATLGQYALDGSAKAVAAFQRCRSSGSAR